MDALKIIGKRDEDGEERKSRAFSTRLVGWLAADPLWEQGRSAYGQERPLWITWTGTEQECRAFGANVRTGRKFRRHTENRERETLEIPKKAGFRWLSEKGPQGTAIVTAYHPGLLHLDPPEVDEEWIRFLCLIPSWWVDAQLPKLREVLPDAEEETLRETASAAMVAAYLDRRSGLPIIDDLEFLRSLVAAGLEESLLLERTPERSRSQPKAEPAKIPGLERMIACCAKQDSFEEFLKEQIKKHYAAEIAAGRKPKRVPSPVILPPSEDAVQLGLW